MLDVDFCNPNIPIYDGIVSPVSIRNWKIENSERAYEKELTLRLVRTNVIR